MLCNSTLYWLPNAMPPPLIGCRDVTASVIGCRYELDDLKHSCEALLETHIDEDSVCCLLSVAEQYNARKLKVGVCRTWEDPGSNGATLSVGLS